MYVDVIGLFYFDREIFVVYIVCFDCFYDGDGGEVLDKDYWFGIGEVSRVVDDC